MIGSTTATMQRMNLSANGSNGSNGNSNNNNNNRLSPSLKVKTNELFYKWLSSKERTEQLKEAIQFIRNTNKIPKITELESFKNVIQKNFTTSLKD